MVAQALGRCRGSLENVILATRESENTPYSKHVVFVNRFTPPASNHKSQILEFIWKSVCPKAVIPSTESENNYGSCLFLSLHLNLSEVYIVGDSWMWLKNLLSHAWQIGQITGVWFWSTVPGSVEHGKTESCSFVFLCFWVQSWLFMELLLWCNLRFQDRGTIGSIQAFHVGENSGIGSCHTA